MFKNFNNYDYFIFVLIASLVGGNLGGALQLPRLFAILFSPALFANYGKCTYQIGSLKRWCIFFLFFSVVSITWTPAGYVEGAIGTIYHTVHLLLFFEIIVFAHFANNPLKSITSAFLIAFAISAVIAFWELTTDQHLSLSKRDDAKTMNTGYDIYVRYFASVTFFNFNMYVTFICFVLPYLFYGIADMENSNIRRMIYVLSVIAAVVLILYNGSRGGLLASVVLAAVYYKMMPRLKGACFYIILAFATSGYIIYRYGESILLTLTMRMTTESMFEDESRMTIWGNVMKVVGDYMAMGCGCEGLQDAMAKHVQAGVLVAHNILLEILAQYGIVFATAFIVYLYKIYKTARLIDDKTRKMLVFQVLISFPIVGIINSHYLTQPTFWAAMASLYVFANYESIRSSH